MWTRTCAVYHKACLQLEVVYVLPTVGYLIVSEKAAAVFHVIHLFL